MNEQTQAEKDKEKDVLGDDDALGQIQTTLTACKGNAINIAYALLKILERVDKPAIPRVLQHLAETYGTVTSSEEIPVDSFINDTEQELLAQRYGALVDRMLDLLIGANSPEPEFYRGMWEVIKNPLFAEEKAQVFTLYYILIDSKIPYFQLRSGLKMANDDFHKRQEKLQKKIQKIRFITARNFDQRTEEASLVVSEINSEKSLEDRSILMAALIDQFRSREKKLRTRISAGS